MSNVVYAVPGVTPKGAEIPDLNKARELARAHGVHVFAYRRGADGSLTMLGSQSPKGRVVKYEENPLKDFGFQAPPFHSELRRMGQTGHTVYRDLKTGVEAKKPKTVWFEESDAALQALAVFLVLEKVDTRGAEDITAGRDHQKMAAIRLPNGDIFSATLSPERNDYWINGPGLSRPVRWGTWAQSGQYPDTAVSRKMNPRAPTSNYGYWVHIHPNKTYTAIKTGPGRDAFKRTAVEYLQSEGVNPVGVQRGGYGADYSHNNERGSYYWDTPAGSNILSFWFDLDYINKAYRPAVKSNPTWKETAEERRAYVGKVKQSMAEQVDYDAREIMHAAESRDWQRFLRAVENAFENVGAYQQVWSQLREAELENAVRAARATLTLTADRGLAMLRKRAER